MIKDTEKLFEELQKYLDQFGKLSEIETKDKIDEFMERYNDKLTAGGPAEKDQWYYLDLAMEAEDVKVARKNAQRALTIDPYCTDAELLLIDLMDITPEEVKKRFEKLIKKTEKHLEEEGYFAEENIGSFYMLHETRPYIRALGAYMDDLIGLGKFRAAIRTGVNIIRLNQNDNMGVRYDLMALHAFMEDVSSAEGLFAAYEEESAGMLFPLILLYYKVDDYSKARKYLKLLAKRNPDLKKLMLEQLSDEVLDQNAMPFGYAMDTIGELMDVFNRDMFLIDSSVGAMLWMKSELERM